MQPKGNLYFSTAIFISLSIILFELFGELANNSLPAFFNLLPFIVMALLMVVVCRLYSKEIQEEIRFRKIFVYGVKVTLIVTVIVVAYRFMYLYILFPDIKATTVAQARSEMGSKGDIAENELDAATNLIDRMFIPFAVAGSFVSTLISGLIGSVIGAVAIKRLKNTHLP